MESFAPQLMNEENASDPLASDFHPSLLSTELLEHPRNLIWDFHDPICFSYREVVSETLLYRYRVRFPKHVLHAGTKFMVQLLMVLAVKHGWCLGFISTSFALQLNPCVFIFSRIKFIHF